MAVNIYGLAGGHPRTWIGGVRYQAILCDLRRCGAQSGRAVCMREWAPGKPARQCRSESGKKDMEKFGWTSVLLQAERLMQDIVFINNSRKLWRGFRPKGRTFRLDAAGQPVWGCQRNVREKTRAESIRSYIKSKRVIVALTMPFFYCLPYLEVAPLYIFCFFGW